MLPVVQVVVLACETWTDEGRCLVYFGLSLHEGIRERASSRQRGGVGILRVFSPMVVAASSSIFLWKLPRSHAFFYASMGENESREHAKKKKERPWCYVPSRR